MIYFHIPFCKQACHYCDFHFSTSLKYKAEMLDALQQEITLRAAYLEEKTIHSIYFGGGTPSILEASEIEQLIGTVAKHFDIAQGAEITLEANPDDLTVTKVRDLRSTPVNRFSIGIQSFFEEDLRWMNRAHNASEAEASIKRVQDAGFENITCDLIYGYPLLTDEKWTSNIAQLTDNQIPHISSYAMTVEQRTALNHMISKGKTSAMNEEQSAAQFEILMQELRAHGYEHYEISNFAKSNHYAKHNTNYWKGQPYLGIGPSAHSFNATSRSWNIANNALYMAGIQKKELPLETEILSFADRFNEYVMTSLRTMWGINLKKVESDFGPDLLKHLLHESGDYLEQGAIERTPENFLRLTLQGKLLADRIASDIFWVEE
ncbi:radical SAM family heme chaperone HemW [Sphingobacterium psychroaquaticum]|uniref:radical SAM family heme chaperone HemW n=1 Tax=Sphingobacterium psychroaquaticum TaxID=561061 RepID=UPI00106D39C2|nr:radical SAM family heme chaperone HemW [Sphingobacterium psychroaquaticum]QBQ39883.1 radical SAM family heme chaperone HemW [Sphingobacterium psychroaquaticum]